MIKKRKNKLSLNRTVRHVMALSCLSLLLLMLAACGSNTGDKAGSGSGSDELPLVSVMLDWYPNAVHAYLYAADQQGYFEEEGIRVRFTPPTNPTDPMQFAAAGSITLGITYQPDVIMAKAANPPLPVVSVAAIVRSPLNHVIFLEDAPLSSPKDLVGKKVGYPGIPVNLPILQSMVTHDGGDFSQVEMVDVGFELGAAIVSRRVDALIGAYINHEVPMLEEKGHPVRYFNPTDYGVPSYYELVIVTGEETWQREEEQIRAFWRAASRGFAYVQANPKKGLDLLMSHQDQQNFPLIRAVEEKSLDILLPKMEAEGSPFGSQSRADWEETITWLYESGLIERMPDVEAIFVDLVE